jgi:formamidopyrimidine-DNA glycosylase
MPELPEVETLKRELELVVGKTIKQTEIFHTKLVQPLSPAAFCKRTEKQKIVRVERRAKILIVTLSSDDRLLVHLKMTGQLIYVPEKGLMIVGGHPQQGGADNLPNKYTRAHFAFTDQSHLYFNDLRKFGWFKLLTKKQAETILGKHGVEPLAKHFTFEKFIEILNKYPKRKLKQLLLDQTLIAGLGNIYVDEACFIAHVLPMRIANTLSKKEQKDLHQGIIDVLKLSISKKGTSAKNYIRLDGTRGGFVPYLNVYGRGGETCKRCKKAKITKIKLNGRGTHFCENCQK